MLGYLKKFIGWSVTLRIVGAERPLFPERISSVRTKLSILHAKPIFEIFQTLRDRAVEPKGIFYRGDGAFGSVAGSDDGRATRPFSAS